MVQLSECKLCHEAKSETPQSWMQHIATYHIIPTEWPSERAKRLTGTDALRPYSTVADSKKKRKKDSVARPLNSFMIFSQYIRRNVLEVFKEHANADMSKQLGKLWGNLDDHFKDQYHEEAERMARLHDLEFPDYKYQPRKGKRNEHQLSMHNSNDLYKQSISANLIQHQMNQNSSPISVVTSTVPLIITSSAFPSISKSNKTFEHSKETVQTKHILCNPNTPTTAFTTQGHISYISGSSDSAYSSEIGSCSSSSVPSPAIGDFLIQSPMKHYVDDRGSSMHHWNVDGRRIFQTPRQASSSSIPEYYTDIAAPNNNNNNEIKTFRKRFYSGTHDVHFSKIPCIAETEEETSIELDVVDQNGNKMKLRIENGSKEILKNLLLNEQDGQNIKQKQIHDQIYLQQQQSNESNCQYITDGSNNYVEYVLPINAQQEISSHLTNGRVQLSPIKMADNSPSEHQQQHATIFAYIPDHNFSNSGQTNVQTTTNQQIPLQLIRTANGNQFDNGQIIMINQDFIRTNQDLRNEINNSILSGNAGIINTGNIQQYQLACGKTLEGLTLESALPSDLAALDTSSLYRIN